MASEQSIFNGETPEVTEYKNGNSEPGIQTNVYSHPPITMEESNSKEKRGWEELQRSWRNHFPKRAWNVVRSYWKSPKFRNAFKNYIGKRSDEEIIEIPEQPAEPNDLWMIDELGYKVDTDAHVIPDSLSDDSRGRKRGWEDVRPFLGARFGKRGWEDVRFYPNIRLGKRGWEDVRLFPYFGKRKLKLPLSQANRYSKRGWEDVRFFGNRRFGKRDRQTIVSDPFSTERSMYDVELLSDAQNGKRGWEDVRLFSNSRYGKRGWEDIRLFTDGRVGKRRSKGSDLLFGCDCCVNNSSSDCCLSCEILNSKKLTLNELKDSETEEVPPSASGEF